MAETTFEGLAVEPFTFFLRRKLTDIEQEGYACSIKWSGKLCPRGANVEIDYLGNFYPVCEACFETLLHKAEDLLPDTKKEAAKTNETVKPKKPKYQSRSARFQAVIDSIDSAKSDIETLKEELENWLDNMPENLQDGQKASELQEAIDALDDIVSNLEDVVDTEVTFPSMF